MSVWNELVPEGNRSKLYNRLDHFTKESAVLMIGHEPYLSNIIYDMIFHKNRVNQLGLINLKKTGMAKIRVITLTPNISGELRWLITPRIMKSLEKGGSKSKSFAAKKRKKET